MKDLRSRAAVVTGVSRRNGIGFAVAHRLLAAGAGVLIHSWAAGDESPDPGGLQAVLTELEQVGGPVAHVEADFAKPESPAAVVRAAQEAFSHIDILVVNHTLNSQSRADGHGLARRPRTGRRHAARSLGTA